MANLSGIMQLYTAYFNRAADKAGVDYWAGMMDSNGWSLDDVAQSFSDQVEYQNQYNGLSQTQIVEQVYQNVLNRAGETGGIDYWSGELSSGNISVSQLVQAIVNAAVEKDGSGNYKNATDASIFNNKIQVSQYCYDNNINATGNDAISLELINTDSSSVSAIQNQASAFIDNSTPNNGNTNINIGIPIYVESKISTDEGNDGSIDWVTNFTYSYENGVLNQFSDGYLQTQYLFDSNGNIIEERSMYDGVVDSTTYYTYNSNGQVITLRDNDDLYDINGTYTWSSNGVVLNGTISYDGISISYKGIGTGLNSQNNAPLRFDTYLDDEIESIGYYTYDSNGNETTMLDDEDADGTIDYAYHTEWILLG